ncbi:MAG: DUF6182 family protein [Deltaproteobacteria bacterium]|nr:DUF6182 family protein [Deltaproteobacteria bacterium]
MPHPVPRRSSSGADGISRSSSWPSPAPEAEDRGLRRSLRTFQAGRRVPSSRQASSDAPGRESARGDREPRR